MFGCLLWFVGESPVAQQVNQKMQNSETSIMEMGVKKAHPWDVRVKVLLQYDATRLVSPRRVPTVIVLSHGHFRPALRFSLAFSRSSAFSSALSTPIPPTPFFIRSW